MASNLEQLSMLDSRYAVCQVNQMEGEDNILPADCDDTSSTNGRVRVNRALDNAKLTSVPSLLKTIASQFPKGEAIVLRPDAFGKSKTLTYNEYEKQVNNVAKAFVHLGLEKYHGVCIIGSNSAEWCISYIASIYAGGFAAGIYATDSAEACQYCAENARANIIMVEDDEQLQKILEIKKNLPELKAIIQYVGTPSTKDVRSWEELLEIGGQQHNEHLDKILENIAVNECCSVGFSHDILQSKKMYLFNHDNLVTSARSFATSCNFKYGKEIFYSYLPLSHITNQVLFILLPILTASKIYFNGSKTLDNICVESLLEIRPSILIAETKDWNRIYRRAKILSQSNGHFMNSLTNWAKAQSLEYHKNRGGTIVSLKYYCAKQMVFRKVKFALGLDRCKLFFSLASSLSETIRKYFMSLDVMIDDTYGMSECTGLHSISKKDNRRIGSVGHPLSGFKTEIKNQDREGVGEICIQGRHVFMGYLNDPDRTREIKEPSNYLWTGDIGKKDTDDFLYVIGRKAEIITTANGEQIHPSPIEQRIKMQCPVISNACVVGDARNYLTVLITLETEVNPENDEPLDSFTEETLRWAKCLGSKAKTASEVFNSPDVCINREMKKILRRVNDTAISNAQRVQKFRILSRDFSVKIGELEPTLKLKRNAIVNNYADLIEEMYNEE